MHAVCTLEGLCAFDSFPIKVHTKAIDAVILQSYVVLVFINDKNHNYQQ